MTTEWIELTDLQAAGHLVDGWEIEFRFNWTEWKSWDGECWTNETHFRGRPKQPKMKTVKMLCYLIDNHRLNWLTENAATTYGMIRVPAEDKTIEVCGE